MHTELAAVAQVSGLVQNETGAQALQMDGGPGWRKYPDWHCEHSESAGLVQVSGVTHRATSVHCAHASATPSRRNEPAAHCVHCESAALVQVTGATQPATPLQAVQVRPSPKKPGGQAAHTGGAPTWFVHATTGFVEQPPLSVAHSSMSVQVTPLPVKPGAQVQEKVPGPVAAQTASGLQLSASVAQASIGAQVRPSPL